MKDIHALGNSLYVGELKSPNALTWGLRESTLLALEYALQELKREMEETSLDEWLDLIERTTISIHFDRDVWDVRANLKLEVLDGQ